MIAAAFNLELRQIRWCRFSSRAWLRERDGIIDTETTHKAVGLDDFSWTAHAYACEGTWPISERHRYGLCKGLSRFALASRYQSAPRCAGRDIAQHFARGSGCAEVSTASASSRSEYPDARLSVRASRRRQWSLGIKSTAACRTFERGTFNSLLKIPFSAHSGPLIRIAVIRARKRPNWGASAGS